jgi:large subunit ribosomal protein L29
MKIKDLREQSVEELASRGRELRKEILNSRVQQAAGQLENTARLNLLRKEIARIHTLLSQRRLGIASVAASKPARPAGRKKAAAVAEGAAEAPAKKRATKKKASSAE